MANKFWVGGTGTWDNSGDTTHWGSTSGTANNAAAPGSNDTVIFDAASGGGTVTVTSDKNIGAIQIGAVATGAFGGTVDFTDVSVTNVTLNANGGFSGTGGTVKFGSAFWNMGAGSAFDASGGATIIPGTSTILYAVTPTGTRIINVGTTNFPKIVATANSSGLISLAIQGTGTIGELDLAQGIYTFNQSTTTTVTLLNILGTASAPVLIRSSSSLLAATVAASTANINYAGLQLLTISGATANSSFNLGGNTLTAINAPSGGAYVIGG